MIKRNKDATRKKVAIYLEDGLHPPGGLDLGDLEGRITLPVGLEVHLVGPYAGRRGTKAR